MAGTAITFDSFSLQSTTYRTEKIEHIDLPRRQVDRLRKSRAHGSSVVQNWYDQKKIKVTGVIVSSSEANFQSAVDTMKKSLSGVSKNLDIGFGSGTRRYIATLETADLPKESYNRLFVPYELEFICDDPFGRETTTTTVSEAGITASPNTWAETIEGSAPPLPVITITLNSATDVSIIKFKNNNNDDEIIVGASYVTGDVLEIDTENKTVKINGTEVDYTGIFPEFEVGSNSLTLTVTGTAFNADVDIEYNKTYL